MTEARRRRKLSRGLLSYLKFFLMLSLSVIVLFGGVQYVLSYNSMQEATLENTRNSLLLLANTHEMILKQVDKSVAALADNTLLVDYMDYFHRNQHNTCRSMISQLYSIAEGNQYIESLCVYYPQEDYTVSSDFGPAALEWYHDADFCMQLPGYTELKSRVFRREIESSFMQRERVLTLVRHMPSYSASGTPKAYVVVNLNMDAMMDSLLLLSNISDIRLLVLDKQNNVIVETGVADEAIAAFSALESAESAEMKKHILQLDSGELLVQSMQTERGWTYYFAQPVSIMMGSISRMQNTLLSVCALVLIVSVVLSLILSRRAFEPIQAISERFEHAFGNEEIYAKREVQSIISRVDSVIARNKQLESQWRQSVRKNRELCFWHLVQDEPSTDVQREEMLSALGIGTSAAPRRLLIASQLSNIAAEASSEWNALLVQTGIQVIALFFPKKSYMVLLFECSSEELFQRKRDRLCAFLKRLGASAVEISEPLKNGEQLRTVWHEQMQKCDLSIEHTAEAPMWEISIENDLLRALKNRDTKSVRAALDAFLLHLIRINANHKTILSAYQKLYDIVSRLAGESPVPFDELCMPNTTPDMLDRKIEAICLDTISKMAPTQNTFYSAMIQEICAYIDANLSEDLSIDRLSERFHLSASSLRKVFRNEVGMTPKEYVDGRRAIAAKQMLRDRELQIQEIANQLGFQYSQSFIAFFRAVEGVTPGEYRAKINLESLET